MLRLTAACLVLLGMIDPARAAPLAEKYLLEGQFAAGEKALTKHLAAKPNDDQARRGLAALQLGRAVENVTQALYRHGLRSPMFLSLLGLQVPAGFEAHARPEKLTHDKLRKIIQAWVDDLARIEATLAKVKSDEVKFPLAVARVKLDVFGNGKRVSAIELMGLANAPRPDEKGAVAAPRAAGRRVARQGAEDALKKLVIAFDRGDTHWLRGYCHFLSAIGELILALDTKEIFDTSAHLFFTSVESPFPFLAEDFKRKAMNGGLAGLGGWSTPALTDLIGFAYQALNLPIKEPARMKVVLRHLEGMVAQGKEMWKHIQAEKDDDREWIPNPKQKGVLGVPVNKERMDNWLATLNEVEAILQGKKLVPFWRGKQARGLNLRTVFLTPPKRLDVVRWVQGTAAAPYLEKGTITSLADPKTIDRLDRVFGGNFFSFAFWFN